MSERKGYYESNMPANGIVVDTQDLTEMQALIKRMKADIQEGQELIERQAAAIDSLLKAIDATRKSFDTMIETWQAVSSASTATGGNER